MKKLFFIPRAILDVLSIWNKDLSWKEKSSLTYTLMLLKWHAWKTPVEDPIVVPIMGYQWMALNQPILQYVLKEIFIEKVYAIPAYAIKKNMKIADIGANIGLASLFFVIHYPESDVVAYEPNSSSFRLLKENIKNNKLENIEAHNVAITGDNEKVYKIEGYEGASVNQKFSSTESREEVDCLQLSKLLNANDIDCLKMDIEGMEYKVLCSLSGGEMRSVPFWMIEFHEPLLTPHILKTFGEVGFSCSKYQDIYHLSYRNL